MPRRLDLSDKGVELMAYLSTQSDTNEEQIARALWPRKKLDRALELLKETANEVNAVGQKYGEASVRLEGTRERLCKLRTSR